MWSSAVGCLVTFTLSLLAVPPLATAQPQGKLPRIGVLEPGLSQPPTPCLQAFQQGLRDLGYVEGHTIHLAYRHAEDHVDRLPALLAELVQLAPDVIWLTSTQAVLRPNHPLERTVHSTRLFPVRGLVPVGRCSVGALGATETEEKLQDNNPKVPVTNDSTRPYDPLGD